MNYLKTKLSFKLFFLFCLVLLYALITAKYGFIKTNFTGSETVITGIVETVEQKDNKTTLKIKGKERVLAIIYDEKIELKRGYKVRLTGKLEKPKVNTNENLFNYQNYLLSQKIIWLFKAEQLTIIDKQPNILYKIQNYCYDRLEKMPLSKDYIQAFILGSSSDIEKNIKESYRQNGISHLLAVSGMHITLLVLILLFTLNFFSKNEKLNYVIVIIIISLYAILTGFKPPIIRALLMFILLTINKYLNTKVKTLNWLLLIAMFLLVINPYYIYDLGFKFSFIVSFFIILFNNPSEKNYLRKVFQTSVVAFLASIPILINNFFSINLLTPFLNVIFIPLVSLVIFPCSLLTFLIPSFDFLLSKLLNVLENLSLFFYEIDYLNITLAKVPFLVIIGYYLLIIFSLLKKNYYILIIVLIIHSNFAYFNNNYEVHAIDVNQGDSTLIRLPHNQLNILIDTGGIINFEKETSFLAKNTLIPYFKSFGITKLDYLILSHGDFDHCFEALDLIENFKIGKVYFNSGSTNQLETRIIKKLNKKNIPYEFISKKEIIYKEDKIKFLNEINTSNENEDSLITYMNLNNKHILFMGDASKKNELYLLNEYNLGKMDILKVGHHGSDTSTSDEFIKKIKPRYAIISVGLNNRYNHPSKKVINLLNQHQVNIFKTSTNGSIRFTLNEKIKVSTCLK